VTGGLTGAPVGSGLPYRTWPIACSSPLTLMSAQVTVADTEGAVHVLPPNPLRGEHRARANPPHRGVGA
jgi:hypothetical protein